MYYRILWGTVRPATGLGNITSFCTTIFAYNIINWTSRRWKKDLAVSVSLCRFAIWICWQNTDWLDCYQYQSRDYPYPYQLSKITTLWIITHHTSLRVDSYISGNRVESKSWLLNFAVNFTQWNCSLAHGFICTWKCSLLESTEHVWIYLSDLQNRKLKFESNSHSDS